MKFARPFETAFVFLLRIVIFANFCQCFPAEYTDGSSIGILIDGDIMLSENEDPWDRRGPIIDVKGKRWANGVVPYALDEAVYSPWDSYIISEGLKEIEKSTCIRFIPRTDEKDYIFITPLGGCWSYLGRKGSEQTLSLSVPDCISKGTIIHEFMHALGFWHEHSRADRDDYVDILWENVISKDKQMNFAKHVPGILDFLEFDYDYMSVMHYNAYAFSKSPNLPTMKPKKSSVRLKELGRARYVGTLTDTDIKKINTFYECPES